MAYYLILAALTLSTVNANCFLSPYYEAICGEIANADRSMSCDDCKNCAIMGPSTDVCDDGTSSGGENPGFHRALCFLSPYYEAICGEIANADRSMSCDDCKNCAIMGPSTDVCTDGTSSGGENPGFHRALCPLQTPVLWNIRFECGAYHTQITSDETLAAKFNKLHALQDSGDCPSVTTNMFIENNHSDKIYKRSAPQPEEAASEQESLDRKKRSPDCTVNEYFVHLFGNQVACADCMKWGSVWICEGGSPSDGLNSGGQGVTHGVPLHVLIVIDMDVDDDVYWSSKLPNKVKNHLNKVNFPVGTTYEIVLAGPNNIFVQYPISRPTMSHLDTSMVNQYSSTFQFVNRKRRSESDATVNANPDLDREKRATCDVNSYFTAYFGAQVDCSACQQWGSVWICVGNPNDALNDGSGAPNFACNIYDKDVLYQRLFAATSSMPAIPRSLYSVAGLSRPHHIGWISSYLHRYLPQGGRTLVMHIMNHESDVDQADIIAYQQFISHIEQNRPHLDMRHHFMFAGTSGGMVEKLLDIGVGMSPAVKWSKGLNDWHTTQALVDSFTGVIDITDPVVTVAPHTGTSCSNSPCRNGCVCEQSCRDENDYVCVPPAGRPFVGKNCEWEAVVQCTADRSIRVSIPKDAVDQYAMGVPNVILQGCNNAPSYICNNDMGMPAASCGPISSPSGNYYILNCPTNNLVRTANGEFSFGQTIVFDRASSVVAMPHPIVNVQCMMATRPAISIISPQLRGPQQLSQTIFWQPMFGFYKTAWGSQPMILAGNSIVGSGEVGYIVGERIHVRITASLNGIPAATLPGKSQMTIQTCTITPTGTSGTVIQIINNGAPVAGTPFPVSVAHDPGLLGGNTPASAEGVGFSFQVFTYGPGSKLQLTCIVHINSARRRRSSNETESETEEVSAKLLIFGTADEEKTDLQTIEMVQDPMVIYMEKPDERAVQIEEISKFILSELPTWFLFLLGLMVILVISMAFYLVKRRYAVKNDYDEDIKVKLFH